MNSEFRLSFGLIIGIVLTGILSSACLVENWVFVGLNGWYAANLPGGERAKRFLPVSDDYVYVESQDGRFFASGLAPDLEAIWVGVEAVMVGEMRRQGHSDCALVQGPWSPAVGSSSPPVEGVECGYWTPDGAFSKYSYAILESGEVWRWKMP